MNKNDNMKLVDDCGCDHDHKQDTAEEVGKQMTDADIKNYIDGCTTAKEVNDFLETFSKHDACLIIRKCLGPQTMHMIYADDTQKSRFTAIKIDAKRTYEYDCKPATMYDVNKACTSVYGLLTSMVRFIKDSTGEQLLQVQNAINRLEENAGLEPTDWDGDKNDASNTDVQGEQKNT